MNSKRAYAKPPAGRRSGPGYMKLKREHDVILKSSFKSQIESVKMNDLHSVLNLFQTLPFEINNSAYGIN